MELRVLSDYKKMYYKLFRAQVKAKAILEKAEKETEAMFMESKESDINIDYANEDSENDK